MGGSYDELQVLIQHVYDELQVLIQHVYDELQVLIQHVVPFKVASSVPLNFTLQLLCAMIAQRPSISLQTARIQRLVLQMR